MLRKSWLLIAALATLLVASTSDAAGWTVGFNGGVSKATGDFGEDLKMGPAAGVDIWYQLTPAFAIGAEGGWNRSKHEDVGVTEDLGGGDTYTLNKDNLNIISGLAQAKYMIPVGGASKISPFGLVGLGFYNIKEDYEETLVLSGTTFVNTDESDGAEGDTRMGGKLGAGAMFAATEKLDIGVLAEYNIVSLDTSGAPSGTPSTFKFWGIRAGLNFRVMSPQ